MAKWCKCKENNSKDYKLLTNFYCNNFIPTHWQLAYTDLNKYENDRTLHLVGFCNDCGGKMRTGVGLPYNRLGKDLISEIWREYNSYRPFGYTVSVRANWYNAQDKFVDDEKIDTFVKLFKVSDREFVAQALEEIFIEKLDLLDEWIVANKNTGKMNEYGYNDEDVMLPLEYNVAKRLFDENNSIYLLYDDDSEGLVETVDEFEKHYNNGGMFGIDKSDFKKYLYKKGLYKETQGDNEMDDMQRIEQWRKEHNELLECKKSFESSLGKYRIDEYRIDINSWVKEIVNNYGSEALETVIAATILSRENDGRFSKDVRNWAKNIPILKMPFDTPIDYWKQYVSNEHSIILNSVAKRLMELEKVTAILIKPNFEAQIYLINSFMSIQKIVGMSYATLPFDKDNRDAYIIYNSNNEESWYPLNRNIDGQKIYGDFIILNTKNNLCDVESLSDEQIEKYIKLFENQNIEFPKTNLFDSSYCINGSTDDCYENKYLILKADKLTPAYKSEENQLWKGTGGFGCDANSRGRKVFATCVADGEKSSWYREDFLGIADYAKLPDWANDKINEMEANAQKVESEDMEL